MPASTQPSLCIGNSSKLRPAILFFCNWLTYTHAKQNPKQQKNPTKTQHSSGHTILLLEALMSLLQQSSTSSNRWLFLMRLCLALSNFPQCFQGSREYVLPRKRKFLSQNNLNQKSMPLGKRNNSKILCEKAVTQLAEVTSSWMGIKEDLNNKGKLNSVHTLPRLLWYFTAFVKG